MDAISTQGARAATSATRAHENDRQGALARARLYHFFELALAHPAPDGLACFRASATEEGLDAALAEAGGAVEQAGQARAAGARFLAALRTMDDAQAEAAHIALFSVGFPSLPCPPYGSLFTVEGDKRLDAMRRIKQVYQQHGFDLDEGFTDLPDHVCVELEFMQALCFREHDAMADGDAALTAQARDAQARFLDEFLLPFAARIAAAAHVQRTANVYADLLAAADAFVRSHRQQLDRQRQADGQRQAHRQQQDLQRLDEPAASGHEGGQP